MDYVIPVPPAPSMAVSGTQARFPIRRVFCVGRNYAAHAREMGKDPEREPPFFFMKPNDTVVAASGDIPYPPLTRDLHHEVELVVAIGGGGRDVDTKTAASLIWGYAVGVDLTRRDLQATAKEMSRPWDWAKGFDASAPCGPIVPVAKTASATDGRIWLSVNDQTRQEGDLAEMIWPVVDVISHVSRSVELCPGDLIFSGTPSGVGALQRGDRVTAGITGVGEINFSIAQ